jgi:hypothetical protein
LRLTAFLDDIADLRATLPLSDALLSLIAKAEAVFIEGTDRHFDNLAAIGRQDTLPETISARFFCTASLIFSLCLDWSIGPCDGATSRFVTDWVAEEVLSTEY